MAHLSYLLCGPMVFGRGSRIVLAACDDESSRWNALLVPTRDEEVLPGP